MTDQLPAEPLPYETPERPERPVAVTALATIGIIFGGLGIIGGLCGVLGILMVFTMQRAMPNAPASAMLQAMRDSRLFLVWTGVSIVIGWTLALVLLVGSIGALGLKQWSRPILIYYAIAALIFRAAGFVMNFALLRPLMQQPSTFREELIGYTILAAEIAFPVLLLIFLTRPRIVAVFEARAVEGT